MISTKKLNEHIPFSYHAAECLLRAIQQGLESVEAGRVVTGEVVNAQIEKWIVEDELFLGKINR